MVSLVQENFDCEFSLCQLSALAPLVAQEHSAAERAFSASVCSD